MLIDYRGKIGECDRLFSPLIWVKWICDRANQTQINQNVGKSAS
ncbi:hypothetical protein [[Phormidium] sp. LEGE 05292]|nr:hypothetical protein [Phormidium sp. LEGE 05292]